MDSVWIESQKLDSLKMKKSEFDSLFKYEIDDENWNPSYMLPEHVEDLKTILEFRNVFDAEVQKLEADRYQLGTEIAATGDNSWPMPVNLKRLIWNAQKTFYIGSKLKKNLLKQTKKKTNLLSKNYFILSLANIFFKLENFVKQLKKFIKTKNLKTKITKKKS